MSDLIVVDTVAEAVGMYTGKSPDHPLIHVLDLSEIHIDSNVINTRLCNNLFSLGIKQSVNGGIKNPLRYGRNHYDFSSGVLNAYAPGQMIQMEDEYQPGDLKGWVLLFHPDLLLQHRLQQEIKQYGYFSYEVAEALHLSEREQQTLNQIITEITREIRQNQDEFSLDILLASIELLLKYSDRYFNRQFLTRRPFSQNHIERFYRLVDEYLERVEETELGLPSVNQLAAEMNMSPNYMSDLLRKQTGKSALELIHQQLIEKAKYRLLNSDDSIATIAYQLGFEYPQYFSRIFKKKTSMSPQEFRRNH